MDSDAIWAAIDSERARVCDLLDGLEEEQWRTPSLCAGWTVREVAAHLTFAQSGFGELLIPLLTSGMRSNVMIRRTAVASSLTHDEITAKLRGFIGSRRHVAIVSEKEPLIDLLVHGQDIAVPLGLDHAMPIRAATMAIDRVIELNRRPMMRLRRPLHDVRLVATDTDWSHGTGEILEGPIRWLLLYVAGRDVALQHLHRPGADPAPQEASTGL